MWPAPVSKRLHLKRIESDFYDKSLRGENDFSFTGSRLEQKTGLLSFQDPIGAISAADGSGKTAIRGL